jgi:hypothetical protein
VAKPFRFENMWTRHNRYDEVVTEAWQENHSGLAGVQESLRRVQRGLQKWSKEEFGSVRTKLRVT